VSFAFAAARLRLPICFSACATLSAPRCRATSAPALDRAEIRSQSRSIRTPSICSTRLTCQPLRVLPLPLLPNCSPRISGSFDSAICGVWRSGEPLTSQVLIHIAACGSYTGTASCTNPDELARFRYSQGQTERDRTIALRFEASFVQQGEVLPASLGPDHEKYWTVKEQTVNEWPHGGKDTARTRS
jgi:hypothetical protein